VSSFATSVGISSSGWWAAGHHPLDEAGKGLQGFAAEMFSGRTRIIGEQEEAGRAYLGGWRPPGAADVLPEAGEDGRSGVEVGGPERVGPPHRVSGGAVEAVACSAVAAKTASGTTAESWRRRGARLGGGQGSRVRASASAGERWWRAG